MYIENENLVQIKPRDKINYFGTLNWKRHELCDILIYYLLSFQAVHGLKPYEKLSIEAKKINISTKNDNCV